MVWAKSVMAANWWVVVRQGWQLRRWTPWAPASAEIVVRIYQGNVDLPASLDLGHEAWQCVAKRLAERLAIGVGEVRQHVDEHQSVPV